MKKICRTKSKSASLYLLQMVLHGEIICASDLPTFRNVAFV